MENNEQPTGYNFDVDGKLLKEHECSICLHLIKNATELPCYDLMCRDCLMYYEEKELERNESSRKGKKTCSESSHISLSYISSSHKFSAQRVYEKTRRPLSGGQVQIAQPNRNADFRCPLCRTVYDRRQKKEVRSTDKTIRQSLEVKCKNWKNGCDWIGCISNYEDHHINVCEFLMVKCPNDGCKELIQRRLIQTHQKSCVYRIVPCTYCEAAFPICWLQEHHESCPSYPVSCHNLGCKELVQRKQMDEHCNNECHHQVVPCLYHEVGCNVQLPRDALTNHNQETMQHHSFLLLKSHVELSKKNDDLEKKLQKSNEIIEQLQETVIKQEESIGRQQAEITCLQIDVKKQEELIKSNACEVENGEKDVKEKLTNLETFARKTSHLFETISEKKCVEIFNMQTLHQKDYDDNPIVKNFNTQVKEKEDEETKCDFLKSLSNVVKNYSQVYFPATFQNRLERLSVKMEKYLIRGHLNEYYVKTNSYKCTSICFKIYKTSFSYDKEIEKNAKWNNHSMFLASYYDYHEFCYYVALCEGGSEIKNVKLLHSRDEKQNKKLKLNVRTWIDWEEYSKNEFFIFIIMI